MKLQDKFEYYKEQILGPKWSVDLVIKKTLKGVHGYCEPDYREKEATIEIARDSKEIDETIIHELLHCITSGLKEKALELATSERDKMKIEKLEEDLVINLEKILGEILIKK